MIRSLVLTALLAALALSAAPRLAEAAPLVSPRNPYRSFNISGINYGSQRWEQSHRSSVKSYRGVGLFRRR